MLDVIFSLNTVWWTLMVIYVPACIGLIGIVLLQQGKGGGFGGALGGGGGAGADTVFGTKSSQTLPVKMTYAGATLFMSIAIILSVLSGRLDKGVAPELLEASEGDATVSLTGSSTMSNLGLGTGVISDGAHNESAVPAVEVPVETDDTTDDAAEEESSNASE